MKKLKHGITISVPSGGTFHAFISTGYLQTVDMRYNIRGQLLSMNNSKLSNDGGVTNNDNTDLFGMQFQYDQVDANLGNTASFDGKLTGVKWMSKDASGNSSYERSYKYIYDQVNRYTASSYAERTPTGTGAFSNNIGGFDEYGITYDAGGNIMAMKRNSSAQGTNSNQEIDNLAYAYSSTSPNQLQSVTDGTDANHTGAGFRNYTGSTSTYVYDANGNLTADPYKGLGISYNYLNRTGQMTFSYQATNRYINYTYDAGGNLVRKQAYDNNTLQTTTDYVDGFVYIKVTTGTSTLSYFPMPEGRVLNNAGTLTREFVIADQQGNARISFKDSGNGTPVVTQENSYYAFGLVMPNSPVALPVTPNKQLYNGGSEWQNDYSNLPDYYQTFNRNYDAAIGRFIGVDPMAESAESMTSYQYAGNNPVIGNDPMGDVIKPHNAIPRFYPPKYDPSTGELLNGDPIGPVDGLYQGNADGIAAFNEIQNEQEAAVQGISGGIEIYHAGDGTSSDQHSGVSLSSLANTLNYFYQNGIGDAIAGFQTLGQVTISDARNGAIQQEAYATGFYNSVNQGGMNCPTCLVPSSVGHNIFENYAGGDNPMSYNGKENYSINPVNYTDLNTMHHDLNYDAHGGKGAMSVFLNSNLIPDDYTLIVSSFDVAFDTNGRITLKDKLESFAVGIFFIYATAPKSAIYWIGNAAKNTPASDFPGL